MEVVWWSVVAKMTRISQVKILTISINVTVINSKFADMSTIYCIIKGLFDFPSNFKRNMSVIFLDSDLTFVIRIS